MKRLRCAIYTRKSSEEGLEQSFNSLDAQREACLAYILSQKGEGWVPIKTLYDDGGFSGGSMERPALRQLLADVAAGAVDVVVVYKVDRLTRSLMDFAKIVEVFDRSGASFVSVTQAFNTTSSMGRLTLNVLLSFAQFEREVTGERIRDKIAASKARGMWMGGNLPLGYDTKDRELVINTAEAGTVTHIFRRYLELASVHALKDELEAEGTRSKIRVAPGGEPGGGAVLSRGALYHLLRNRIYLGEIVHRDKVYPGRHPPILDRELFEAVQLQLNSQVVARHEKRAATRAPLTGLLFGADGQAMTPTHTRGRAGVRHSYYVSTSLVTGGRASADPLTIRRAPAHAIEELVLERLRTFSGRPEAGWNELGKFLQRVEIHPRRVILTLSMPEHASWSDRCPEGDRCEPEGEAGLKVIIETRVQTRGGRTWLVGAGGRSAVERARHDRTLVGGLRRAHRELSDHGMNLAGDCVLPAAKGIADPYTRRLVLLGFLAPDIQSAILEGRQVAGLTLQKLVRDGVPLSWAEQRRVLEFTAA